jgi:hypothetical protein
MSPRILVLVAMCACGRIDFATVTGDGHITGSGDDDGDDGSDGSAANSCLTPGYGDSFDEISPCQAFGMPMVVNGMLTTSSGMLTITPNPSANTDNGCVRTNAAYGPAGVFIEMSQVATSPGQTLMVISTASSTWGFEVNALGTTTLSYVDTVIGVVEQPYDPVADRWLRIRPIGNHTQAETSPNGMHWTMFATSPLVPTSPVNIDIYVQTDNTDTNPGTTVIEGIDVCP